MSNANNPNASSSEDIIRHIIRDIVAHSTTILKNRKASLIDATSSSDQQQAGRPQPPLTPIPQVKHLFASGIKSHIPVHAVSDTLAAFFVRAVVLDQRNEFHIERELSKEDVERLINECVNKITSTNNIVSETIKMQVYFDSIFPAQADYLHREKMTRIANCSTILREITEVKSKNISIYEGLYRKIVSYVILRSHVGNATDIRVIREATAALESVFPQSELSAFISLSRAEKEAQLNGLTQLVTGIRLFNKQLGKGGETVDDLIALCATELQEISKELGVQMEDTEATIQSFMAVLDYSEKDTTGELTETEQAMTKSGIVFYRQYLMYLDALHEQLGRTKDALAQIGERFDETIRDLKATCKAKTAVPVDQVYPMFIALANLWSNWMDELFLVAFRRGILDNIDFHARSFEVPLPEGIIPKSAAFKKDIEPEILPENDVIMKASELMAAISVINKSIEVVHPGNTTQYFKLPVEYGGFCSYSLIRRDGLVVPGDKNIGLLRYRDRLFAFATPEGAREFAKFPDRYMEGVLEMAKRSGNLVQLLHLYNYFPTVDALENAKSFTRQRLMGQMAMVSEAGSQVDTHIIDARIDPKYQWNEWELRRQALMLVNLKKKKTHSAQTDISHYRRESETQHYEPKLQYTQTSTESSTSVPRKVNYLAGLRNDGTGESKFHVLDLTVDM
ncbi:hypothetical protein BDR26DRAFT_940492 [Obelidium mucronatum]|nr:hypothetical protein BDR26DRAFT_940492 [Obelidium mucronatum]